MSLGDFDILAKLGEGSYSTVFKAQRKSDKQLYALKKVRFNPLNQKEKENALTEVRVLASINHPNIVAYKEAFMDDDTKTLCIVMEFCDDGDLLNKIEQHKKNRTHFPEAEVWNIFTQASAGLKALHDLKILHRDLKSANIFLTKAGVVKIGDLNVSKVAKGGLVYTQTGTPYYASPEVWKDQPYDYKSDVWSLGCVIYEALALHPPFRAADMKGLYRKVIRGEYPALPPTYSGGMTALVSHMLKVNPMHRPTVTRLLSMPSVQGHSQAYPVTSSSSELLKTIQFQRNGYLGEVLPKPKYDQIKASLKLQRHKTIGTDSLSTAGTPLKTTSEVRLLRRPSKKPSHDYIAPEEPLRLYHDLRKADPESKQRLYHKRSSKLSIGSPVIPETIAARIRVLKGQYAHNHVSPPRKVIKPRAVHPPVWWG